MDLGVSYFGNRIQRYVRQDMRSLRQVGCTYVLHTFSENDYHFYRGSMKEIVKISHDEGLQVYIDPWGVGKVFGGEAFTEFALSHHDTVQILNDGLPAPMACPNNASFRNFMKDWIDAAIETGADVLFWDEPHFYLSSWLGGRPNTWACFCSACNEKYSARYGSVMPRKSTEELEEFRQASLRDFLEEMIVYTHTMGKKNALCVLPSSKHAPVRQIWDNFASISGLNIFGTDPYWYGSDRKVKEYVGMYSEMVHDICVKNPKLRGQIWIQGFKVPAGKEKEIETAFDMAVKSGIRNIAVWAFEACSCMSSIRADNPELAWDIITKCFMKYKDVS